jgi:hypothetical protein
MTLIVLALLGLMVLVVTVSPPESAVRGGHSASAPLSDPEAFDVSETLSADPGAPERTVDAEVGDRVLLTVEGAQADSVALGDMDVQGVEQDSPARFELLADTPGSYPLTLVNAGRRIGTLEVH